ncbi:MAG: 2-oxoacid:acceptor oxidoreductase subunit alpha [Nitrospirota bacterium]|nr:2-oxoacid:acceptor oxidoreductase subunit alpha [Nitrospirota bacterium]
MSDARLMQGNEAAAEGALAAGCRFYAGYPITPSSELMEHMAKRLPELGGAFIQMEDEIGSIAAVIGASWAGAKAMTATSGPGLSLMQENIGYAVMTEAPCVIVNVMRAGPCTGQATKPAAGDVMQVRWGSHGDYQIIALSPWSVQEMFDMSVRAFNLAETYRVPVFLLADEAVAHLREGCVIPASVPVVNRKKEPGKAPFGGEQVPPMPAFGEGEKVLVTGSTHDEWGYRKSADPNIQEQLIRRLSEKITANASAIVETESHWLDDADVLIVAYGIVARSSMKAVKVLREQGVKAGLLRLKTLWPFPEDAVRLAAEGKRLIIVPEMNLGQVALEVERVVRHDVVCVAGVRGEVLRPEPIIEAVNNNG